MHFNILIEKERCDVISICCFVLYLWEHRTYTNSHWQTKTTYICLPNLFFSLILDGRLMVKTTARERRQAKKEMKDSGFGFQLIFRKCDLLIRFQASNISTHWPQEFKCPSINASSSLFTQFLGKLSSIGQFSFLPLVMCYSIIFLSSYM